MNLKGKVCEDVEYIHVAEDMVQWLAYVNTVMNL
jgi:hypothetical protein